MEYYNNSKIDKLNYITEEDVKTILCNSGYSNKEVVLDNFNVYNASDKMLGFLADYWKLQVVVTENRNDRKVLSFFIKAVSRSNASKATMVKELNLFQKEVTFYATVKNKIDNPGLRPWSAKFVTALDDAIVFQDLNALQYKMRNKFERFDMAHTLQALRTLANLHASSIIFEEKRKKELGRPYLLTEEYALLLDEGGYKKSDPWFVQCQKGALEAIKTFSNYGKNNHLMCMIESRWDNVWSLALDRGNLSSVYRNVICHRDLWNNNLLFHYKKLGDTLEPDDCVLVDFQATRFQPLAGDVMLLLYCNLDSKFREENMAMFLNYYHQELRMILSRFGISIDSVLSKEDFFASAEEQRLWGLVLCACLIPQFWIDDDLTTSIFNNSENFVEILSKDKATFIKKMMQTNQDYKKTVLTAFEEIAEKYCM